MSDEPQDDGTEAPDVQAPTWSEDEIPPWDGYPGRPFHPERIPPLDPVEFRRIVLACIPQEWPKEFPDYWARPVSDAFSHNLFDVVGFVETKWTPVHHRFFALLRLLQDGQLGAGWPNEAELLRSEHEVTLHPALLHTAAQLPILPSGEFDPVEFRREAVRVAKRMGLALPPGLSQDE